MDAGPIDVLNPAAFDLGPLPPAPAEPPDPLEAELIALEAQLERDVGDLAAVMESDPRAELDSAMLEASEGIFTDLDCGDDGDLIEAGAAALEVDELQIDAYGSLPAEAWEPVPEPYQHPAETGGLVEDRGPSDPLSPGLPITPPPPAPPSFEVGARMVNLSGGSEAEFHVGEWWKIMVSGPPGCPVSCQAWVDGEPLYPVEVGYTDQGGWFTLQGVMGVEHLGFWMEQWAVGGVACLMIGFNVVE